MQRVILLVEDNPDEIELTLIGLQRTRVTMPIVSLRDGVDALQYLRREAAYANRPDIDPAVVILDVRLPKLSGLDVLRVIRSDKRLRCIPVVFLSSSRNPLDVTESYRLGANAYIVKPYEADQFMEAVKQLGEFWGVLNEVPGGECRF